MTSYETIFDCKPENSWLRSKVTEAIDDAFEYSNGRYESIINHLRAIPDTECIQHDKMHSSVILLERQGELAVVLVRYE